MQTSCHWPVKAVDHGTSWQAASDAGPSEGHSAGVLAQVVSHCSNTVHVAPAGTQAARQTPHAALADAGVMPGLCYWSGVW